LVTRVRADDGYAVHRAQDVAIQRTSGQQEVLILIASIPMRSGVLSFP
jgi:hypothetical protein